MLMFHRKFRNYAKHNFNASFFIKASVDLDQVAKELDVYTLQQNIDHLTFCNIDSELVNILVLLLV
jgi:hypothetical protein